MEERKIKKILNNLLLCVLILTLIYVCYCKYVKKDLIVKLGGYGMLVVMTGSMEPELEKNELILIKESQEYSLGDVVTYVDVYGSLVTHRILEIDESNFITKGDNNKITDESTNIKNIQGKVIYHSKVLGVFVLYYLKFVILIYVAILLVLCFKDKFIKEKEK